MKKPFALFFVLNILILSASAQIPNASFESWDTVGVYSVPQGWDNMNPTTTNISIYTCTQGNPGTAGTTFLMLTSRHTSSMGTIPGIASPGVLNKYDVNHPLPQSGFPYSQRPNYLSGMWEYMPSGIDQGYVAVLLSKWDSAGHKRDTIASARQKLTGMQMLWAPFSIMLNYMSSSDPDSAIIVLSASGLVPTAGSYLHADQLAFTDTVMTTGINDMSSTPAEIEVFPNPANTKLTVRATSQTATILHVQLADMTGRPILEMAGDNSDVYTIDTGTLAKGNYIVKLQTNDGSFARMIVIE